MRRERYNRNEIRDFIHDIIREVFDRTPFYVGVIKKDNKHARLTITKKSDCVDAQGYVKAADNVLKAYFSYVSGSKTPLIYYRGMMSWEDEGDILKILETVNERTKGIRKWFYETLSGKELIVEEVEKIIIKNIPNNLEYIDSDNMSYNGNKVIIHLIGGSTEEFSLEKGITPFFKSLDFLNKETALLRFYFQRGITSKNDIKHLISSFE